LYAHSAAVAPRKSKSDEQKAKASMGCNGETNIKKHHQQIAPLGVSLLEFVVKTGRLNGRYGVES
jgi:hypothetical protein